MANLQDKRRALYKEIYITARKVAGTNDGDHVRVVRDMAVKEVTTHTRGDRWTVEYTKCTIEELEAIKRFIEHGRSALQGLAKTDDPDRNKYATQAQLKKLHYLILGCAIHYAPTTPVTFGDITLEGEALKKRRYDDYESARGLRQSCKSICYKWAIPKIHRLLADKGLRQYKHSNWDTMIFLQWADLKREEASEIIKYFNEMYNEIQQRYRPITNPNYSLN